MKVIWTILALATFFLLIIVAGMLFADWMEGGL